MTVQEAYNEGVRDGFISACFVFAGAIGSVGLIIIIFFT